MCSPILLTTANYATAMTLNLPACILHLHTTSILYTSTIESYPRCLACIQLSCLRLSFPAACPPRWEEIISAKIIQNHVDIQFGQMGSFGVTDPTGTRTTPPPAGCNCLVPRQKCGEGRGIGPGQIWYTCLLTLAAWLCLAMPGYAWAAEGIGPSPTIAQDDFE